MKALEKDRTRRYETANGLAADIRRYLNDDPVEACPPSTIYRFRKFAHRNRATLATIAGFVVVLAVAAVVSTCLAAWALREKGLADNERADALSGQGNGGGGRAGGQAAGSRSCSAARRRGV